VVEVVRAASAEKVPWKSASDVSDQQGVNMAIFGHPGSGKTTLAATAQDSDASRDVLFVDFGDAGIRSIQDRKDIQVFAAMKDGEWDGVIRVSEYLKRGKHPFKTLVFDTLSGAQKMALRKVMTVSPTPGTPGIQDYGKANELVLALVNDWCAMSRETGINVIFNVHALETKDEDSGIIYIRMALTPGVREGLLQRVDAVGYLSEERKGAQKPPVHKLVLRSNARVLAKYRQPRTGPQLPLEIENPNLGRIVEHSKGIKLYADE
jgi:hypothetical protein